jgi:hypothetical protein
VIDHNHANFKFWEKAFISALGRNSEVLQSLASIGSSVVSQADNVAMAALEIYQTRLKEHMAAYEAKYGT